MKTKIRLVLVIASFFFTQFVTAAPLSAKKKPNKLMGDLPQLVKNWSAFQNSKSAALVKPNSLLRVDNNLITVDAVATGDAKSLTTKLRGLGMRNTSTFGKIVSGQFPIDQLSNIGSLKELNFIRPSYAITRAGSVTSQGDVSMKSDIARIAANVDGTGITVGTLSDSFNCKAGYANDVTTGDLPSGVNVLDDTNICPGGSDEGRAMMQIIHDVAPGASLSFHTAFNGQADFATGIQDLANAGAKVIVDDIYYFAEPFFQDGIIAQSIDTVVASGVTYFSSAGNSGRDSYESAFRPSGTSVIYSASNAVAHDFDPGVGVDTFQQITVPQNQTISISLQWNQPFSSIGGSGATTDIDIALYNSTGTTKLASSTDSNGGGDPVEVLVYKNTSGSSTLNLVIEKYGINNGPDPALIKYVGFRNLDINEYNTNSSTVVGHSNAASVVSVGAAYYQNTPAFGVTPPLIENFSSAGGTSTLFDVAGNPINITRSKPDIVAPDGGNNTFFGGDAEGDGFPNFFGTSAAAPHAAAVAALMLQQNSTYTPASIISKMESTAVEMDVNGYDFNTGHGLINAEAALALTPAKATLVSPSGTISDNTPTYTWNAVSNSTWYYLWVADSSSGSKIKKWYSAAQAGCSSGAGTCSITPTIALANGASKFWIQTWNTAGDGPWSSAKTFTLSASLTPAKATLVSPSGAISDNTPTYTWNAVSNSTWYYLWVADSSSGSKIKKWYSAAQAGCSSGAGTCSITPTIVLANGAGNWWVQTWNSAGKGPWSSVKTFTLSASLTPAKATLVSPSGVISDNTPTYTWNAVSNSTWYYLWVADSSSGSKIKKWYSAAQAGCNSGAGTCSITPTIALANGAGNWWVQTWNSAGKGPWSSAKNFNIQ